MTATSGENASLQDLDRAPSSLPTRPPTDVQRTIDDLRKAFTEVSNEKAQLQQDLDDLRRGTSTIRELDALIKPSAKNAFTYMSIYSIGAFVLLVLDGSRWKGFNLDDGVLQLLVGSTAATVLGLVGMVLTGIFVGARRATRGPDG